MSAQSLECVEVNTGANPQHTVIWLHGLGASGNDFEPIVPELQLNGHTAIRFIFPHAPMRPITINGGMAMRGWYDIDSLDFGERKQDDVGIRESAAAINALIDAEIERGVQPENIVLAGFSQGGAVALYTGLTSTHNLCGIIALSTYLPIHEQLLPDISESGRALPVLMVHGRFDDVIALRYAEQSRELLESQSVTVQWHEYPMAHNVCLEEITAIGQWLKTQLRL